MIKEITMNQNGTKGIALRVNGIIPIAFEIQKNNGFSFCVAPTNEILEIKDIELKNQMMALWATRMSRELGLPVKFWLENDILHWEPPNTKWAPVKTDE
jgi:hypothetical protein